MTPDTSGTVTHRRYRYTSDIYNTGWATTTQPNVGNTEKFNLNTIGYYNPTEKSNTIIMESQIIHVKKTKKQAKILIIEDEPEDNSPHLINKGTGAGGSNTNYYGKIFEEKTNNETRLLEQGFIKNSFTKKPKKTYDYFLSKSFEDKTIIFVLQNGLKMYMKNKYDIELFRCPDEAYII